MTKRDCALCGSGDATHLTMKDGFEVVRCRDCSLVFVADPPTEAELARFYSADSGYHAERIAAVDTKADDLTEARGNLRILSRHRKSGRLLDVGCSTGQFLRVAREAGWQVSGLEYSDATARVARERHGLDVRTGALDAQALAGRTFDVITLWDVLEHLPEPRDALLALRGALCEDGLLVVKTPRVDGLFPALSLRVAPAVGFWRHPEPPGHLFQFSRATLERLLRETGFVPGAIHHERIPVVYSFGRARDWFRSASWAAYCAAFIPAAVLGPWIGYGDTMTIVARRATAAPTA
jgi:2-polyprenyl-3-methyl-5-hydroxy-6-metoxy-1,4-benzoquinol methylase